MRCCHRSCRRCSRRGSRRGSRRAYNLGRLRLRGLGAPHHTAAKAESVVDEPWRMQQQQLNELRFEQACAHTHQQAQLAQHAAVHSSEVLHAQAQFQALQAAAAASGAAAFQALQAQLQLQTQAATPRPLAPPTPPIPPPPTRPMPPPPPIPRRPDDRISDFGPKRKKGRAPQGTDS